MPFLYYIVISSNADLSTNPFESIELYQPVLKSAKTTHKHLWMGYAPITDNHRFFSLPNHITALNHHLTHY